MKPTKGIFIKVIENHGKQGDSTYIIIDLETKKRHVKRVTKLSTNSQCGYIGTCHAIFLFKERIIYTPNKNVVKWVNNKAYHSKKYSHIDIEKCDNFLNNLEFNPNVVLWDNVIFGKYK